MFARFFSPLSNYNYQSWKSQSLNYDVQSQKKNFWFATFQAEKIVARIQSFVNLEQCQPKWEAMPSHINVNTHTVDLLVLFIHNSSKTTANVYRCRHTIEHTHEVSRCYVQTKCCLFFFLLLFLYAIFIEKFVLHLRWLIIR